MSSVNSKPLNGGRPIPTNNEWESHRRLITLLYLDEDRTLKEVMEYMSTNCNFHASPRMFKRKFANWKLDCKHVRASIAIAAYQKTADCYADSAIVMVEGRQFNTDKIRRYYQRKSQDILRLRASIQRVKAPDPQRLRSPDDLRFAEKLLSTLAQYIDVSFQTRTWVADADFEDIYSTKDFISVQSQSSFKTLFLDALKLLRLRQSARVERVAFHKISLALESLKSDIVADTPLLLSDLGHVLVTCSIDNRPEIGQMLAKHTFKLSRGLLGSEHPIALLAMDLGEVAFNARLDILQVITNLWDTKYQQYLLLQTPIAYLSIIADVADILDLVGLAEQHEQRIKKLLQTQHVEKGSRIWLRLQNALANALCWQNKNAEALAISRTLLGYIDTRKIGDRDKYLILSRTSRAELDSGSSERGRDLLWQAIGWAEQCWGRLDPDCLDDLNCYVERFPEDLNASRMLDERCAEITSGMEATVIE
ncbi:hypothetical protein GQ53DRAFT_849754 [Thozetella sp. PMI_491]|nr:hypothetical protein GQ53DRAFT_849754 [Thozetella sp. PMI_491]